MPSSSQVCRMALLTVCVGILGWIAPGGVSAATFTVNSLADDPDANPGNGICATAASQCTLRAAVQEANALGGANTINLPGGLFSLGTFLPITSDITITGAGIGASVVDGGGATRHFDIASVGKLHISGCNLQNGVGAGYPGSIENGGALTIDRCVFAGNRTSSAAGAIDNNRGTVTITNSLFADNRAGGNGGAISNFGDESRLSITNCTFSRNSAGGDGGALRQNYGAMTLVNVTITGNTANATGFPGHGGGIGFWGGSVTMVNVILSGNKEIGDQAPDCWVGEGTLSSLGNNLIGTTTGCTITGLGSTDLVGVDPLISALGDNGGASWTHALFPGSPAIDTGSNAACPATDQRGVSRPRDGNGDGVATCDIGAFEFDGGTPSGEPLYVLGTAYVGGFGGTHWRTDLEVHNRGTSQASYSIALLPWNQSNLAPDSRSFTLDPGKSLRYENAVQSMFGFTGSATLRVLPVPGNLIVTSRTFNDSATGTYGQGIGGAAPSQAWRAGKSARMIGLAQATVDDSGFRTNLSLANATAVPLDVKADYYRAGGTLIASKTYHLREFESQQISRCFRTVTGEAITDGYVVVSTATPGGEFFAAAHLIDQRSGDPTFIAAQ